MEMELRNWRSNGNITDDVWDITNGDQLEIKWRYNKWRIYQMRDDIPDKTDTK